MLGCVSDETNLDLSFNECPFRSRAQFNQHPIKRSRVSLGELEPRQEIERLILSKVTAVMQATGNSRQILQARRRVMRLLLEDFPAFILSHGPPRRILP